jgi:ABC-2 type transport system ATP-binding protein
MTAPASLAPDGSAPVDGNVPVLAVERLWASYGGEPVLEDVTLTVPLGEWFALLGPNGSGKTTLLHCVAGLLAPLAGGVRLSGISLEEHPREARRTLGFACAAERLPPLLTGRQCLEVHAAAKAVRAIDRDVIDLAQCLDLAEGLDRYVETYSLGTRHKLAILLALIGAPRLILLDEAFNGLDPDSAQRVKQHLRGLVSRRRSSVVLATHALDVVERYADRAALLLRGRVVQEWHAAELATLRQTQGGLEGAVAGAARRSGAADEAP